MKMKVEGHPDLIRDGSSKAIVSEDPSAYQQYINEKNFRLSVGNLKEEMDNIKDDISEIKHLLAALALSK